MPFSDVLHQRSAQDRLQRALQAGRAPHAYLFAGPDGVGKRMLAARLAAMLLCDSPQSVPAPPTSERGALSSWIDACGGCDSCRVFAANNHPDFHYIHRALNRLHPNPTVRARKAVEMSVDVIRHFVIDRVMLSPSLGRAKLFVIAEAHRLSVQAQNALLKTLEEPPDHSYLILLADSEGLFLPTTRSRCQMVSFRRLPSSFIVDHLVTRRGASPDVAQFLAELSQGSLGVAICGMEAGLFGHLSRVIDAVQVAGSDPLGSGKRLLDLAKDLVSGPAVEESEAESDTETSQGSGGGEAVAAGASSAAPESEEGTAVAAEAPSTNAVRDARKTVLAMTASILRDMQRVQVGGEPASLPNNKMVREFAGRASLDAVGNAIRSLASAEYQIDHSANVSLIFDAVGISLGRAFVP